MPKRKGSFGGGGRGRGGGGRGGGRGGNRGGGGGGGKKGKSKKHLQEYGEEHPVMDDVSDSVPSFRSHAVPLKMKQIKEMKRARQEKEMESQRKASYKRLDQPAPALALSAAAAAESSSDDDEGPSAYSKLLGLVKKKRKIDKKRVEEEIEEDEEEEEEMEEEEMEDEEEEEEEEVLLTKEELEAKRKELGDDFEIVAEDEEEEEEEEEEEDGGEPMDQGAEEDGEGEGASDGEEEEEEDEGKEEDGGHEGVDDEEAGFVSQRFKEVFNYDVSDPRVLADLKKKAEAHAAYTAKDTPVPSPGFGTALIRAGPRGASVEQQKQQLQQQQQQGGGVATSRIKSRLRWSALFKDKAAGKGNVGFTAEEGELFRQMDDYKDLLFPMRTFANEDSLRNTAVLHVLNHCMKTKSMVIKNNAALKAAEDRRTSGEADEDEDEKEYRDQGFTRPRVLIILPYRSSVVKFVDTLLALMIDPSGPNKDNMVRHKKRFYDEYGLGGEEDPSATHPNPEYREYFRGNIDDCFRLGISLTRTSVNLYTEFYTSDIIIASPLGLRMIVGADGDKDRDFDFLSSIEVCVVDQAESLLMQNFEHVSHLFAHMNRLPMKPRDTDITRIRHWSIEGLAKYFRQTIVFSAFHTPELKAIFSRKCANLNGAITYYRDEQEGAIAKVVDKVSQVFHRLDCGSFETEADERFKFFVSKVLPEILLPTHSHVLVYIPSYFDFVRLRNHFRTQELTFAQICEYTTTSNVSRARSYFYHGERKIMLYTERHHYHFRPRFKRLKHVVFYGLPQFPQFYPELLNFIGGDSTEASVTVLYTKYDAMRLERIAGTQRAQRLLTAAKNVHMFV